MFKVVGRYTKGAMNTGFLIEEVNETKKQIKCSHAKFIELVKSGIVQDFKVATIDEKECLIGIKNDISTYPIFLIKGNLCVVNRILDNGHVVGYKVKNIDTNEESNISNNKAWELSFYGTLSGVRALLKKENGKLRKILMTS